MTRNHETARSLATLTVCSPVMACRTFSTSSSSDQPLRSTQRQPWLRRISVITPRCAEKNAACLLSHSPRHLVTLLHHHPAHFRVHQQRLSHHVGRAFHAVLLEQAEDAPYPGAGAVLRMASVSV